MYFPRSMMIGKALLSGFWECPECLSFACSTSLLTLDPSHRRFYCCLTTSVHGVVVASIEVFYVCELLCLDGLLYVISGILAGGIPGFRIVLCCFTHTTVWQCDFCVSVFSLFLFFAYQYLSWYNAITSPSSIVTELDRRSLSSLPFWCVFFVWLCFYVFCCFWCCLVVCCVSAMESWRRLDLYRSHTSSLLWPPTNGSYLYALICSFTGSMQHATGRVERPGESQEALDGKNDSSKKKSDWAVQPVWFVSPLVVGVCLLFVLLICHPTWPQVSM